MARGRLKADWLHTSNMMALVANVNRSPKRKPFKATEFDPFAKDRERPTNGHIKKVRMKDLKGIEVALRRMTSRGHKDPRPRKDPEAS